MGGGSGGMIRSVQRAVRAGVGGAPPEPFSASANTATNIASPNLRKTNPFSKKQPGSPNITLSSSSSSANGGGSNNGMGAPFFSSLINLPVSAASGGAAPSLGGACSDESDWVCVDGSEDERARGFYEDFVFGTVPSKVEAQHAVSALQQVFGPSPQGCFPKGKIAEDSIDKDVVDEVAAANLTGSEKRISFTESEMDWVEPSSHLGKQRVLELHGSDGVHGAFHLLQTEPSVQRMVISLSSDKAVWDAVLNNEVVKELRGSITQADNNLLGEEGEESSGEGPDDANPLKDILSKIFVNAKAKIMQLVDKITKLVNEVFQQPNEEKKEGIADHFEEKLRTSLQLSVVVLLIVVVTRVQSA